MGKFKDAECNSKADVEAAVSVEVMRTLGSQDKQLKLIGDMIALLYAYQGVIPFGSVGIPGVTDKATADAYVLNTLITLWSPMLALRTEADNYIKDNNLK